MAILALPDSAPLALVGLFEVLSAAGRLWGALTGELADGRLIEPVVVARTAQAYPSVVGLPIQPDMSLDEAPECDVIIVADVELPLRSDPSQLWEPEIAWLKARSERTALICSTCSGSLVLAEGGMLDGCEAASHWSAQSLFRDRYPLVRFRADRILCHGGAAGSIITTGGASSWQDLALYLIGRFCGAQEASRVARIFLIGDRSDGQLPYAAMARPRGHADAAISECQSWIAANYEVDSPVTAMADRSALPLRTFKRRFRLATGFSPLEYVQALRIEEAKQMLECGDEPVDTVADAVGYADPAFFRRLFRRRVGIAPAQYRRKMRSLVRPDR